MDVLITILPEEVQEFILSLVEIPSLTSSMRCCRLWHRLGQNILKRWCLTHISQQILTEIVEEVDQPNDWLQIALQWAKFPTNSSFSSNKLVLPSSDIRKHDHLPVAVSGDVIFVAHLTKIFVFNIDASLFATVNTPHNCLDLKLLKTSNNKLVDDAKSRVIVSCGKRSMCVQTLTLTLFSSKVDQPLISCSGGNRFAFYANSFVNVYEVFSDVVSTVCQVKSRPVRTFQLWMNQLIVIDYIGCLTTYSLVNQSVIYTCNRLTNVFRYPLNTVIRRGVIFADLKLMKAMLNYWHVDMGSPEWIICNAAATAHYSRCQSKINVDEEITTFAMKLAVIVAGTNKGKICFYRHLGSEDAISSTISKPPMFVLNVIPDEHITYCDFSIVNNSFHLCLRTKFNSIVLLTLPTNEIYS